MPLAKVNDFEMYYEIIGEGTHLVMVNGYCENLDEWTHLVPISGSLSEHHTAITCDNRGIGRSSRPEGPYSTRTMADDIAGLLDNLEIDEARILGASMGGMIAQEVALNYPDKVESLVLVASTPGGKVYDIPGQREALEKLSWMYDPPPDLSEEELMDELFGIVFYPKYFEENMEAILSPSTEYPPVAATLEKQFDACVSHDTYDRLGSIKAKTLVIHGEDDLLLYPEGGRTLADNIPDATFFMVNEAGHAVLWEKWEEIYPVIVKFLKEVDA